MLDPKFSHLPVFSLINELEKNVDFKHWSAFGVNLWPIIRIGLRTYIKNSSRSKTDQGATIKKKSFKLLTLFIRCKRILLGFIQVPLLFLLSSRKKYLYMTDGVSFDCIDGVWGDKYFRGLELKYQINPDECLFLSPRPLKNKFGTLNYKIFTLEWLEDLSALLASIYVRAVKRFVEPSNHKEFINILKYRIEDTTDFMPKGLTHRAYKISVLGKFFNFLLRLSKIEKIFIVSFYHDMGFSLNIVARDAAIDTCDIQHGTIISHEVYCDWNNMPRNGYKELASHFFTWDKKSSHAICSWSNKSDCYKVVETGNLSHFPWLNGSDLAFRYDRIISLLKQKMGCKDCNFDVLVTLQPVLGFKDDWDRLANIICENSLNVRWWLRHHPTTMSDDRREGIEGISAISLPNVDYDNASALPLSSLLRNINLHVSVRSSTHLEAAAFGVNTLFISEYGVIEHSTASNSDNFLYANSKADIKDAIQKLILMTENGNKQVIV